MVSWGFFLEAKARLPKFSSEHKVLLFATWKCMTRKKSEILLIEVVQRQTLNWEFYNSEEAKWWGEQKKGALYLFVEMFIIHRPSVLTWLRIGRPAKVALRPLNDVSFRSRNHDLKDQSMKFVKRNLACVCFVSFVVLDVPTVLLGIVPIVVLGSSSWIVRIRGCRLAHLSWTFRKQSSGKPRWNACRTRGKKTRTNEGHVNNVAEGTDVVFGMIRTDVHTGKMIVNAKNDGVIVYGHNETLTRAFGCIQA